jgi:hypothetical protein
MASQKKTPYQQFLSHLKKWRDHFSLSDVLIDLTADLYGMCGDHPARTDYDPQARTATVYLDEEQAEDAPEQLDYLAFHEVSHIRYSEIEYIATRRDFNRDALEIAIHRLIILDWERMKK